MYQKQKDFGESGGGREEWMRSPSKGRGRSRLAQEVENYEREVEQQRQRYENAIVTLHAKVASLRTTLDLEESRSRRQQELIETLELEVRSSKLVDNLKKEERSKTDLKFKDEIQSLLQANLALKFQLALAKDMLDPLATKAEENRDPNLVNGYSPLRDSPTAKSHLFKNIPRLSEFNNAVKEGNESVVRNMLQISEQDEIPNTCDEYLGKGLLYAVKSLQTTTACLLIDSGAQVGIVDEETGKTALHLICENGLYKALEQVFSKQSAAPSEIDRGCKEQGQTPLHLAAQAHRMKCVTMLLRYGANPSQLDNRGKSPLDLARDSSVEISTSADDNPGQTETISTLTDPAILFWAHSVRANRLYGEEKYQEALDAYNDAISLSEQAESPLRGKAESTTSTANKATLQYNSARAAVKLGLHVEAIKRCSLAIDIKDGDYPNAVAQRAASYLVIYDYAHAIADYEFLIKQANQSDNPVPEEWNANLARAKDLQLRYRDHYYVLGVAPEATSTEIKKAFRKQCLKWHPDKHRGSEDDTARASVMFKAINEANEVLQSEQKRTLFDIDRISRRMDDIVRRQQESKDQPAANTDCSPVSEVKPEYMNKDRHYSEETTFRYPYETDPHEILSASSLSDEEIDAYNVNGTDCIESDSSSEESYIHTESKLPHSRVFPSTTTQSTYRSSFYTPAT